MQELSNLVFSASVRVAKGTAPVLQQATFEDPWFEDKVAAPTWGA